MDWQLNFFEVDFGELSKNLLLLLKCSLEMLKFTFNAFHNRLSQHPTLIKGDFASRAFRANDGTIRPEATC